MAVALLMLLTSPQSPDAKAFADIKAERNAEAKKKQLANFLKNFPDSRRLPEVYIELSRNHAVTGDLTAAMRFAENSVQAVSKLKKEPTPPDQKAEEWQVWVKSVDESSKSNMAWVKQMIAWKQQAIESAVRPKR